MPADAPPSKRFTTSGKVLRHRTVTIDPSGEILIKGPCVFMGYWNGGAVRPEVDADGWFHTGDLGRLDEEGYLSVHGRRDALIISGGENIQPEEIEHAMMTLDGIQNVIVVPKKHARFGQRPVAFVKSETWDEAGWRKQLLNTMAAFKVPDAFLPWPDETDGGALKISRKWFAEIVNRSA
jgi:O-succinylbenzoic acid--CoA ligase